MSQPGLLVAEPLGHGMDLATRHGEHAGGVSAAAGQRAASRRVPEETSLANFDPGNSTLI